ncbi:hypothetical protein [Pararhodobacter zhoushanensis]|uniref:hypothetical protein n=1 Tax=Pararhodobacter zhoushanensis TaxID=2479545 RepID=UPI000F8C6469|nr:hypothetical protein [Pararhodobacter zhoushanensis]
MSASVLLFGHGVPLSDPVLAGLAVRDITRLFQEPAPGSRIDALLEPFLDPYVRGFLLGMEARAFDEAAAIVVWRQGAGALHAYRYATELRRQGLLPAGPPLHLWNRAVSAGPAAQVFDARQDAQLTQALARLPRETPVDRAGPLAVLEAMQAAAQITGGEAFRRRLRARACGEPVSTAPVQAPASDRTAGPRFALAGAPLGGRELHAWLDRQGALVLDLQGPDAPRDDVGDLLTRRRVSVLVWQVDPNDDLHGWRKPALLRLCAKMGIRFVDLGFLSPWPQRPDLPKVLR